LYRYVTEKEKTQLRMEANKAKEMTKAALQVGAVHSCASSSHAACENRSTHRVKPFYPSRETVLPIKWKPFYPSSGNRSAYQTVLPFKRSVCRYSQELLLAREELREAQEKLEHYERNVQTVIQSMSSDQGLNGRRV
jgi:hypothetical protein